MRYARPSFIVLTLSLLLPAGVAAEDKDSGKPIHIEADNLEVDDARGISIYRGSVQFTQGGRKLTADELTIFSVDHARIDKVIATGKPTTFRYQPEPPARLVRGEAFRIEYFVAEDRLLFQDGARLWQGENEFAGKRIEFDANVETVKASRGANEGERVQVILQPRTDAKAPPASPEPTVLP